MSTLKKVRKSDLKSVSDSMESLDRFIHGMAAVAADFKMRVMVSGGSEDRIVTKEEDERIYQVYVDCVEQLKVVFATMGCAEVIINESLNKNGGPGWFRSKRGK